jgi:uncharacterized protein YutE (UPF0331/DUF86 family)
LKDEVLVSKAESIERRIRPVREAYVGHEHELKENWTRQDAIILNLQRACEAAIDMANRMIKLRRLGYPKESRDSFTILQRAQVLDRATMLTMHAMVGFRNVAVQEYLELDLARVRDIIEHRLDDLLAFSKAMLQADPAAASPPG